MKLKKSLFMMLAAALCAASGSTGCRKNAAVSEDRIVKVVAVAPTTREFQQKIRVQANIQASVKASLASKVAGTLDTLNVGTGSEVKNGDLLFQIDHENLRNDVVVQEAKVAVTEAEKHTAEINLALAKNIAEKARVDLGRAQELFRSRAVSKDSLEKQELNFNEASAGVEKAAAQLNYYESRLRQENATLSISRKKLADSSGYAPFDGVVVAQDPNRGEYMQVGTVICRVESRNLLELSTMISSNYYDSIEPGRTRMVLYGPDGKKLYEGLVTYRGPNIENTSRTFEVKSDLKNIPGLISGMLCDLDLILVARRGVGVPNEALTTLKDGSKVVFVMDGGKAVAVPAQTGIMDGAETELLNAAELKGRPVIVEGQTFLGDGDRVEEVASARRTKK